MMTVVVLVMAYFIGSLPFGYIIVRITEGKDVRKEGSGNIGATNVLRTGKKWEGILTLLLDAGKGYMAVMIARWILGPDAWGAMTAAAFIVVLGHIFTIFLRFKGGKGVATGCGAYLALTPYGVLTTLVLFVLVVALTRYVSLGSILATGLFPLWSWLWGYGAGHMIVIFGSIPGAILIIMRHRANIRRLIKGEENKLFAKSEEVTS